MTALQALGWDHPRCIGPMLACSDAWCAKTPGVTVEWSFRSLEDFGDQPLEEVAGRFDLVVIDHPFCGRALETGCLAPLDALVSAAVLDELAEVAIGPSHTSYAYGGHQWALATDAACHVAAVAPGHAPPSSWDEALDLAADLGGRAATPLSPPHAISSFLTLAAGGGGEPASGGRISEPEVGGWALDVLVRLAGLGPEQAFAWEPPDVLRLLTGSGDSVLYVPLTYGYVTYATDAVARPCRFGDVPGALGAVLGGAGLAVSASSGSPTEAAAFAAWASGSDAQSRIVGPAGGQPGSRAAWDDEALDEAAGGFFSGTRASIEGAWMRPREPWWPRFQLDAGTLLTEALATRRPVPETFRALDDLYRERSAA